MALGYDTLRVELAEVEPGSRPAGWEFLGEGEQPWDLFYRRPRWD